MKNENGLGLIGTIFLTLVIAFLVFGAVYFIRSEYAKENFESVRTNMLLVQAKVKKIEGEYTLSKKKEVLKGTPIKEMQEEENIQKFLENNSIDLKEKNTLYYVLSQQDLEDLELKVTLPENTNYVVEYSKAEVYLTSGFIAQDGNTYYSLSQIEELSHQNENALTNETNENRIEDKEINEAK